MESSTVILFPARGTSNGTYVSRPAGNVHDVFFVKCLEAAKKLPPEIQQLFSGFYGIGKRP